MMQLDVDGVFVGSGIFKSAAPAKRAEAMVQAVVHYADPKTMADVSEDLGEPMVSSVGWGAVCGAGREGGRGGAACTGRDNHTCWKLHRSCTCALTEHSPDVHTHVCLSSACVMTNPLLIVTGWNQLR